MNKAYKVVFNKVRGTMMVVNEATSSIQKKGVKTVVATLVSSLGLLSVGATAGTVEITSEVNGQPTESIYSENRYAVLLPEFTDGLASIITSDDYFIYGKAVASNDVGAKSISRLWGLAIDSASPNGIGSLQLTTGEFYKLAP